MKDLAKSIPVRNAWYLLLYAWDQTRWKGMDLGAEESAPGLTGLLARVLVESTRALMRHGLRHEFQRRTAHINGIRGRIQFGATLKRQGFSRGEVSCTFPELRVDTVPNRIIRATAQRLVLDPALAAGGSEEVVQSLRHELRAVVRAMVGVTEIEVRPELFSRIPLSRNEAAYELPLLICELLAKHSLLSTKGGDRLIAALLENEIEFSVLFERFVRNFYRHHLPDRAVGAENLQWPLATKYAHMPIMRTDTTIESKGTNARRIVVETKYYPSVFVEGRFDAKKVRSEHLFQLYAYLRTQEERGPQFRTAEGVLLYPTTEGDVHEQIGTQGHLILIANLDLARPWQDIERRLLELVR